MYLMSDLLTSQRLVAAHIVETITQLYVSMSASLESYFPSKRATYISHFTRRLVVATRGSTHARITMITFPFGSEKQGYVAFG